MADTFRKVYTPITDAQKAEVLALKEKAEELIALMADPMDHSDKARCLAIARTHLETAVMFAVKGLTA